MQELILHIGAHKTGTSTIQNWIYNHRNFLEKGGITPFFVSPGNNDVQINQSYYFDHSKIEQGKVFIKDSLLPNLKKCRANRVVMSSECFSWILEKEVLDRFKRGLDEQFSSVKILIYIRRQDRQALSHYQQRAKSWEAEGRFFSGDNRSLPNLDNNAISYLDYNKHFSIWGDVFGDENISFRVFDRKLLKYNCVVCDFLHNLRVPFSKGDVLVNDANVSLGLVHVKIAHILRSMNIGRNDPVFKKIIKSLEASDVMLPSRSKALEFYSNFKESNTALNRRFNINSANEAIFTENFDLYQESAADEWTEDTANKAIETIIRALLGK